MRSPGPIIKGSGGTYKAPSDLDNPNIYRCHFPRVPPLTTNPVTMELALADPNRKTGFANKGLVWLNLILSVAQISSYATGYDGSMMSMEA